MLEHLPLITIVNPTIIRVQTPYNPTLNEEWKRQGMRYLPGGYWQVTVNPSANVGNLGWLVEIIHHHYDRVVIEDVIRDTVVVEHRAMSNTNETPERMQIAAEEKLLRQQKIMQKLDEIHQRNPAAKEEPIPMQIIDLPKTFDEIVVLMCRLLEGVNQSTRLEMLEKLAYVQLMPERQSNLAFRLLQHVAKQAKEGAAT